MLEAAPIHGIATTCRGTVGEDVAGCRTLACAHGDQLLRSQRLTEAGSHHLGRSWLRCLSSAFLAFH